MMLVGREGPASDVKETSVIWSSRSSMGSIMTAEAGAAGKHEVQQRQQQQKHDEQQQQDVHDVDCDRDDQHAAVRRTRRRIHAPH